LVEEATLACTGVRWDLLVVTAGLGFQERRPVGEQPAREEVDRAATSDGRVAKYLGEDDADS